MSSLSSFKAKYYNMLQLSKKICSRTFSLDVPMLLQPYTTYYEMGGRWLLSFPPETWKNFLGLSNFLKKG